MVFYPLRLLSKTMTSVKDEEGQEQEINWKDPYQRVKFFLEYNSPLSDECIDTLWRGNLKLLDVSVSPTDPTIGKTLFEFTVSPILSNAGGNLHGGAVAVMFDVCTSMTVAAVSREGFWDGGAVSRSLNCQYLRPAPKGDVVIVESEVVHLGGRMGQVRGEMRRKRDGKVCYTCVHDKVQITGKL